MVVTTNMFGDIGSDIAAKVTGGVGLVSSNNINPNNPKAVSMFETMGGTADDIAGKNMANPVALIDAAAEMLLHIGGKANILGAETDQDGCAGSACRRPLCWRHQERSFPDQQRPRSIGDPRVRSRDCRKGFGVERN